MQDFLQRRLPAQYWDINIYVLSTRDQYRLSSSLRTTFRRNRKSEIVRAAKISKGIGMTKSFGFYGLKM